MAVEEVSGPEARALGGRDSPTVPDVVVLLSGLDEQLAQLVPLHVNEEALEGPAAGVLVASRRRRCHPVHERGDGRLAQETDHAETRLRPLAMEVKAMARGHQPPEVPPHGLPIPSRTRTPATT